MSDSGVEITAGLGGFLVLFGLALTVWLLGRDLMRRLRRMRLREEERIAAQQRRDDATQQRRDDVGPGAAPAPDEPDPLA